MKAAGYERMKQSHHCSKCSISGHSIKTCTKQCKHCNHQTCSSHFIIWEDTWGPKCSTRSSQSYLDIYITFQNQVFLVTVQCEAKFQSYRLPASVNFCNNEKKTKVPLFLLTWYSLACNINFHTFCLRCSIENDNHI